MPKGNSRKAAICSFVGASVLAFAGPSTAEDLAPYRSAYSEAIRCFIANGSAYDDARKSGDGSRAARLDTRAREAHRVAFLAGQKIGFTEAEVRGAIQQAQPTELGKLLRSADYRRDADNRCKGLGL